FKEAGANTVETSEKVYGDLYQFSLDYPDFTVRPVFDQAEFIQASIDSVIEALYLGGVFAFISLIYFLRDFKNPLIVGLSIPVSIVTTFICMYFLDIHFNIVSLGGLALGIGILVDNSIVVLENIYRYRELGHTSREAAVLGTEEVGLAITASTLTTMAVFLPLVYVKGMAGALFYQQAVTISLALAASLLVSITLLPMLSSRRWKRQPSRVLHRMATPLVWTIDLFQRVFGAFFALYERVLAGALRHRYTVMVAAFALLALSGWLAVRLDRELMPDVDRGHLVLHVELPTEASLSATSAAVARLEHRLRQEAGVRSVLASVGIVRESVAGGYRPGLNKAVLDLELAEGVPSAEVERTLEAAFADFGELSLTLAQPESVFEQLFQRQQTLFDVKIVGPQLETLAALSEQTADFMRQTAGFAHVVSDLRTGKRTFEVVIDRDAAINYGIRIEQLTDFINRQLQGSTPTQFVDFVDRIDIRVRAGHSDELDPQRILSLQYPVQRKDRTIHVPLSQLIRLEPSQGYEEIHREDQSRTATITATLQGIDRTEAQAKLTALLDGLTVPSGHWVAVGTHYAQMQEQYRNLYVLVALAVILVYCILAAQFESLVVPFVIVAAVPLASMGVVFALWATNNTLNIMSLLGCIVLVGIVVNDSIVKVDFIHKRFRSDGTLQEAIVGAGQKRFRPICMTTLTTVCGLLPMALSSGSGAELRHPLAWAIVGGLSLATLLTLIVIPILYSVVVREKV
ncbi:MAG: efflux RND transporter permease subunit, partial [Gemmatimonadetes bacterium]|nr:efflux RND transporter permease subunit [Gemmatimonadota bacterium]